MEKTITNYLRELIAGAPGPERNLFSGNLPSIIGEAIANSEKDAGLRRNAGQRRGIEMALHHPLSVLTGRAGAGKTTVLQVIHRIAEQVTVPVLQLALSGRVAQRLREATERPASTIAAFLLVADQEGANPESEPVVGLYEADADRGTGEGRQRWHNPVPDVARDLRDAGRLRLPVDLHQFDPRDIGAGGGDRKDETEADQLVGIANTGAVCHEGPATGPTTRDALPAVPGSVTRRGRMGVGSALDGQDLEKVYKTF